MTALPATSTPRPLPRKRGAADKRQRLSFAGAVPAHASNDDINSSGLAPAQTIQKDETLLAQRKPIQTNEGQSDSRLATLARITALRIELRQLVEHVAHGADIGLLDVICDEQGCFSRHKSRRGSTHLGRTGSPVHRNRFDAARSSAASVDVRATMPETINELKAIHTVACAATVKADRTLSPENEAFWPVYLQAAIDAMRARATPFGYVHLYPAPRGPVWRTDTHGREINGSRPMVTRALFDVPPAPADLTQAARDVLVERQSHVDREGWPREHDDEHAPGTLALAAAAYALDAGQTLDSFAPAYADHPEPLFWPFSSNWWKPVNPRRSLVKAAALILAEIERIDRDPGDESGHHHTGGGDHA